MAKKGVIPFWLDQLSLPEPRH